MFERLKLGINDSSGGNKGDVPHFVSEQPIPMPLLMAQSPVSNPHLYADDSNRPHYWNQLEQILHCYNCLMGRLIQEVDLPQYRIEDQSRMRIREDIVSTHRREMRQAEATLNTQPISWHVSGFPMTRLCQARRPSLTDSSLLPTLAEAVQAVPPVDGHQSPTHEAQQAISVSSLLPSVSQKIQHSRHPDSLNIPSSNAPYFPQEATAQPQQQAQVQSDTECSRTSGQEAGAQFAPLEDTNPDYCVQSNNDPNDSSALENLDFEQFMQGDAFNFDATTFDIGSGIEACGLDDDADDDVPTRHVAPTMSPKGSSNVSIPSDQGGSSVTTGIATTPKAKSCPPVTVDNCNDTDVFEEASNIVAPQQPIQQRPELIKQPESEDEAFQACVKSRQATALETEPSISRPRKRRLPDVESTIKHRAVRKSQRLASTKGNGDKNTSPQPSDLVRLQRESSRKRRAIKRISKCPWIYCQIMTSCCLVNERMDWVLKLVVTRTMALWRIYRLDGPHSQLDFQSMH